MIRGRRLQAPPPPRMGWVAQPQPLPPPPRMGWVPLAARHEQQLCVQGQLRHGPDSHGTGQPASSRQVNSQPAGKRASPANHTCQKR